MSRRSQKRKNRRDRRFFAGHVDLRKKKYARAMEETKPETIARAFARIPYCPLDLVEKLRRGRGLNRRDAERFNALKDSAAYTIGLSDAMILNFELHRVSPVRFLPTLGTTELPSAPNLDGNAFLAMFVVFSCGRLGCRLEFPRLTVDGDSRTVLVSGHACKRLCERAGIKGSAGALVAHSVNACQDVLADSRGILLRIVDPNGNELGFAPLSETRCAVEPRHVREKSVLCDQPSWLMKTFLLPEMLRDGAPCARSGYPRTSSPPPGARPSVTNMARTNYGLERSKSD